MKHEQVDVRSAIEDLYSTFRDYRAQVHIGYGLDDRDDHVLQTRLRAKKLRELSGDDLEAVWSSEALCGFDTKRIRHFLPRFFEVMAQPTWSGWPTLEHFAGQLRDLDFREWPHVEQATVDAYLRALWRETLSGTGPDWRSVFKAVVSLREDPEPYLALWRQDESLAATVRLAELVGDRYAPEPSVSLDADQDRAVTRFLRDPTTRERLERAFFEHADDSSGHDLSLAVELLSC
ncbi:hypothetical protein [Polyangium sp. 15x6]|uniref:hypothetical protein n=1 Tax=Polyangium sp. 15x6 TaxID=3042687 RepID=UPI00249A02F4|nr:hypothetical protein [Polyangium sp. 15x6]MDI3291360.1 hypothetical protein [Polyangium sp. 15x6]